MLKTLNAMSVQTFYRLAVWLPLAVPGVAVVIVHGLGLRATGTALDNILQLLLVSLVYGGIPYAPIAVWATIWIGGRTEKEIRRRALRAPIWMIVTFLLFSAWLAIVSANLVMAAAVFVLGVIVILPLGYFYVAMVFALRESVFGQYTASVPQS
ncbi:MAG TPA: hypothetical protein VES67_19315 [Vicinamibacterales bacterium]|nr:hypothetical protein [Vicinamibacterales bacterium]